MHGIRSYLKFQSSIALNTLIALTLLYTPWAMSQSSTQIQSSISETRDLIRSKKSALDTVLNRLSSYQFKNEDAKNRLKEVRDDLIEAENELAAAQANTSNDAPRLQEMAQRRLELAQHNVESHQARLERVNRKSEELQREADQLGTDIQRAEKQLTRLTTQLRDQMAQEKEQAEEERQRLQAAIARAEKEAEEAKLLAEQEAEAAASSSNPAAPQAQLASTSNAAIQKPSPAPLTPLQRYARREMQILNQRIKDADKNEDRHFLELIMEVDREDVVELEYLGNNQFYSEIPLSKGKHKITINLRRFIATVPDEADGDTFVVIYDATDKENGRFVIFNKNLL